MRRRRCARSAGAQAGGCLKHKRARMWQMLIDVYQPPIEKICKNVLGCFRDDEVLSGIADTVPLIWRRNDLAGRDEGRLLFYLC